MTKRPTSITVIGWILIVTGALFLTDVFKTSTGLRSQDIMARSPVPIPVQFGVMFAAGIADVVCGYYLLQGKNWARYLFVIGKALRFSYGFVASPVKLPMLVGGSIYLLTTYFLFRSQARPFFAENGATVFTQTKVSMRQILSVCCYVVSGFFLLPTWLMAFASASNDSVNAEEFGAIAKFVRLGTMSVLPLVFLLLGCALSVQRRWKREIGVVLTASVAAGLLLMLMLLLMYLDPEFQKGLTPEKTGTFYDYTTGFLWIGLMGVLGGLGIYVGGEKG